MKKCGYCGLLSEDPIQRCKNCGFTEFDEKPQLLARPQSERKHRTLFSSLPAERHGAMVTLKCRTPAEAYLVLENLESADVIALVPKEEEMLLQYRKSGYVEVQVPAEVYESSAELRSVVEFSTTLRDEPTLAPGVACLPFLGKLFAAVLGLAIVPGLLVFAWLLTGYNQKGETKKARQLKLWFFVGVGIWILLFSTCYFAPSPKNGGRW